MSLSWTNIQSRKLTICSHHSRVASVVHLMEGVSGHLTNNKHSDTELDGAGCKSVKGQGMGPKRVARRTAVRKGVAAILQEEV